MDESKRSSKKTTRRTIAFLKTMNNTFKFLTNVPAHLYFPFNDFREGVGQWGKWFRYAVQHKGVDKVIFAKEGLHSKLQAIGSLQGKELTVTLQELAGGTKAWKIEEKGVDITPSGTYTPKPQQNVPQGQNQASGDALEKMRAWAIKTDERLNQLELDMLVLTQFVPKFIKGKKDEVQVVTDGL